MGKKGILEEVVQTGRPRRNSSKWRRKASPQLEESLQRPIRINPNSLSMVVVREKGQPMVTAAKGSH